MAIKNENDTRSAVFTVMALCCHVKTTERQERKIERMFPPYDDEMRKWQKFAQELKTLGAEKIDHEFYGGLSFLAPDEATGRAIARRAIELLNKPTS